MPGTENSARDVRPAQARAPRILCAGIIVLDEVFYVENLPPPDGKVEAKEFFIVNGGCAANAAVTVARLGGRAMLAGPMGSDANGDFVLAALAREKVDCAACQRVPGLATALSAIFIDARGDRTIVTHRDERVAAVIPSDPEALAAAADIVLADNRFPVFVGPICAAARRRGLRIVLDADKRTVVDDPLLRIATHVVFSSECLIATAVLEWAAQASAAASTTQRTGSPVIAARSARTLGAFSAGAKVSNRICRDSNMRPRPMATRPRSLAMVRPPRLNAAKPTRKRTGATPETSNDT
jgi:sugar/nucleoside kinase (ribokinase family)